MMYLNEFCVKSFILSSFVAAACCKGCGSQKGSSYDPDKTSAASSRGYYLRKAFGGPSLFPLKGKMMNSNWILTDFLIFGCL